MQTRYAYPHSCQGILHHLFPNRCSHSWLLRRGMVRLLSKHSRDSEAKTVPATTRWLLKWHTWGYKSRRHLHRQGKEKLFMDLNLWQWRRIGIAVTNGMCAVLVNKDQRSPLVEMWVVVREKRAENETV